MRLMIVLARLLRARCQVEREGSVSIASVSGSGLGLAAFSAVQGSSSLSASPSAGTDSAPSVSNAQSPADWLMNYARMTPAQQMRARILAQMKLSEADLKAMSPADRQKVEDKIKQQIDMALGASDPKKPGLVVNLTA